CNLRRLFLLRRVPFGFPFLGRLLGRPPPLRLLALRLGLLALRRWGGGGRGGRPVGAFLARRWSRRPVPAPVRPPRRDLACGRGAGRGGGGGGRRGDRGGRLAPLGLRDD